MLDARNRGLERVGDWLRAPFFREFICPYFLCVAIYYWIFASRFLRQDIVMGGDTQLIWSFFYFNIFSLLNFHEFAWWDPTSLNGWPAYYYATSVYVSYLSPFTLPVLGLAWIGHLLGMSINTAIILHVTLISYGLNLLAIMLISRELIRHPLARFLPALIFTLSEISFHGFRDAWLYASMPPALFYLFGLIYYNRRRTPSALIVFVFLTGAFLASLNYAFLQSSLYWTFIFTILLLAFFPDLPKATWTVLTQVWATRYGRALLAIGVVFWISAFAAFFTPMWLNLGNVVRVSGGGPIDYNLALSGDFGVGSIAAWPAWTTFLMWSPMPELHDKVLKFDPWGAGIDHRYLGMATLPLLCVALTRVGRDRHVLVVFLTFAVCALFIIYTGKNLALLPLLERFPILQNMRTMSNTMPREGPCIMIMLLAGIGLDQLLKLARARQKPSNPSSLERITPITMVLLGLLFFGFGLGILGASSLGQDVRESLTHMAIYLTISTALCLVLLSSPVRGASAICTALLIFAFMDLVVSASAFWKVGKVWFANQGVHRYPSPAEIAPISSPEQNWPGSYHGLIHNLAGGPYYGLKTWLVLAYRPAWQPVLVNWDPHSLAMKAYPSFQFFTNGVFIPFETITRIGTIPVPGQRDWYQLSADRTSIEALDGTIIPIRSGGLAGFVERADIEGADVRFSGWAIDETAKMRAARILVFAGGRLWVDGSRPYVERPDVAGLGEGYRFSGFSFLAKGLPPADRLGIRVFALLADGSARELSYSAGFPFTHAGGPSPNPLPSMENVRRDPQKQIPFYIHDKAAIEHIEGTGRPVKDVPVSILRFSPNTVAVRVTAPSDMFMISDDNYDRFWTATIDGSSVPVYRANYTYKAVRVPAGEHVIEWRYNPWPVKMMWLWFYLVLAAFGLAWLLWRRHVLDGGVDESRRASSAA